MRTSPLWRVALASAASAAVIAAPLVGAGTAHAQYPPPGPSLTLSPDTVEAGEDVSFTGTGFAPNQFPVTAALFSKKVVLGRFQADRQGVVEGTVTIPECTKPGLHTFKLFAHDPDLTLRAPLEVLPPANGVDCPDDDGRDDHDDHDGHDGHDGRGDHRGHHGQLADTGDDDKTLMMMGGAAAGLAALGGGTVLAMRRHRRS
ncbi:LPXTG cell wall anchor domain-containing protein [Streptomyces sp. SudanB52_2052]|uniref:LPXTG cell wall anchor domain-containing protein n=1 Tax=Streptomyces sp. SudanB52_2052 TaxID=3035276 RepID=UPI002693597D